MAATSAKVVLTPSSRGEFAVDELRQDAAEMASHLLQRNHEEHHIFFNKDGYHNHIAHHLLTIFALGATPAELQKQYDHNASYQRPPESLDDRVVADLRDPAKFSEYLGKEKYYLDFLVFFQKEMEEKGYESVLNEFLFKGDERADDMLIRMYAGFLHPLIHLGFGIEFQQPAIIAEGLAQAAVHDTWIGPYLIKAEEAAKKTSGPGKSMIELLDAIRANKKLSTAASWNDGNKVRDGILARAPEEMLAYASQWKVQPEELEEKTAEMINAAVYFTGAAQHPPKQVKMDFYFMHCVNCSIFFSPFLKKPWISTANKVRLLEWKGRLDLAMYASRRSPQLLLDEISNYHPKDPAKASWNALFERITALEDDGHASKFVRALAHGEQASRPFEKSERFRIKDKMWLQLGNMVVDSVEDTGKHWVRSAGFEEAWANFEDRPRAQL